MNRHCLAGACAALLALGAATAGLAAPQEPWRTYQEAQFGYSGKYPSDLLGPMPELLNGGGRHFRAKDESADVSIWADLATGQTLAGVAARAEQDCLGGQATDKAIRATESPPFMTLSCMKAGGEVFYAKALECKDVITQIQFTYAAAKKAIWDPVVTKMTAALVAGCGGG